VGEAHTIKTNVYIDGFNLYYGCLKGTPYKWLDIDSLFRTLLPKNQIHRIRYFTAKVDPRPGDLGVTVRQLAYLRALSTLPAVEITYGSFLSSAVRAPVLDCEPATGQPRRQNNRLVVKRRPGGGVAMEWVFKSEEKGSDVNLASYLLKDAFTKECDCAVVVSNDSDLITPVTMAKNDCGLVIGLITPRPTGSMQLRQIANFQKPLRAHHLATSQFPQRLTASDGVVVKPASW